MLGRAVAADVVDVDKMTAPTLLMNDTDHEDDGRNLGDTENDNEEGEGYGDPFFGEECDLYGNGRGLLW